MFGFRADGSILPGWPEPGSLTLQTAGVDDLDCDGEIDITTTDWGHAYLWDASGSSEPGWPYSFPSPFDVAGGGPGLGDVDGNGVAEIGFPMFALPSLYLFDPAGVLLPGFPITYDSGLGSGLSMADVDGDGDQELWFHEPHGVWLLDGQGQPLPGWPLGPTGGNAAPAIGDIDGDGNLEAVWGTTGGNARVHAYNHDGTVVPGWPVTVPAFSFNAQATLGDVDGDGGVDIVLGGFSTGFGGGGSGRIYAWHADGTPARGFPFDIPEAKSVLFSSVTITDLDQDGDVDLLVGTVTGFGGTDDGRVFAFDLGTPYNPATMEWPTLGHDVRHTSRYEPPGERLAMKVELEPEVFVPGHPPAVVTARLDLPTRWEAEQVGFRIERIACQTVEPIIGKMVAPAGRGRGGPDRIVQFDGGALAAALRAVAAPRVEVLRLEVASERFGGRWFLGGANLRTARNHEPAPDIQVSPLVLDLGDVDLDRFATGSVVVENAGTTRLQVTGIDVQGAGFRSETTAPLRVDAGSSVPVSVRFDAFAIQAFTGTLTIASDDPETPEIVVSLLGAGVPPPPQLVLGSDRIDFGEVLVGFPMTLGLRVENRGRGTLEVSGISADHPAFSPLSSSLTVPPNSSEDLEVTVLAAGEGGFSGTVRFSTNDPAAPEVSVSLAGAGVVADLKFVSLLEAGEVLRLAGDGSSVLWRSPVPGPLDLQPAADRSVWAVGFDDSTLWRVDSNGAATRVASSLDGLIQPWALTLDERGRLLIADAGSGEILMLSSAGTLERWADLPPGSEFPTGLALLPTGEVAVCDAFLTRIMAVAPDGSLRTFAEDGALLDARDCATGPDGKLYVAYDAGSGFGPSVLRFEADGRFVVFADGSDGLASTWGLAIDSSGRVYVADVVAAKVQRYEPDGTGSVFSDLGADRPYGVAAVE